MNKKVLAVTIALLAVVVVATPLLATVQAKKTIIPFDYTITGPPAPEVPGEEKFSGDGHVRISQGTQRTSAYNGPLGTGSVYSEGIISITYRDDVTTWATTWHGHGNYRMVLTIDSGPYGTGTLEGVWVAEWDADLTEPYGPQTHYYVWGNVTYQQGTGDLKGIRMDETIFMKYIGLTLVKTRFTGEIVLP